MHGPDDDQTQRRVLNMQEELPARVFDDAAFVVIQGPPNAGEGVVVQNEIADPLSLIDHRLRAAVEVGDQNDRRLGAAVLEQLFENRRLHCSAST